MLLWQWQLVIILSLCLKVLTGYLFPEFTFFELFVFSLSGKIFIRLTGGVDTRSEYMRYVPVILSDAPIMYNFHRDIYERTNIPCSSECIWTPFRHPRVTHVQSYSSHLNMGCSDHMILSLCLYNSDHSIMGQRFPASLVSGNGMKILTRIDHLTFKISFCLDIKRSDSVPCKSET